MGSEDFSLAGRRILITGASSGIGRACAVMAAQLGADVVLTARREDALEETRQMVLAHGENGGRAGENGELSHLPPPSHLSHQRECLVVAGDLADESFVRELVKKAGPCDGLVHAAGVSPFVPAGMISADALTKAGRVNCGAFIDMMNLFVKRLRDQGIKGSRVQEKKVKERGEGEHWNVSNSSVQPPTFNLQPSTAFSAVVVSSVSAAAGWAGGTVYCATKGAVSAAVRALAIELAPQGVRVNAVCPSGIATPLYEAQSKMNPEAAARHIAATQPLGLGKPEQVAAPVCFLLSDAASFITGVNLPVDGGFLAR